MRRPPVGAAPAEIVAPISLRRVKPGQQPPPPPPPQPAPPAQLAVEGKGKRQEGQERALSDPTQGGIEAGPSRARPIADRLGGVQAVEQPQRAKKGPPPQRALTQPEGGVMPVAAALAAPAAIPSDPAVQQRDFADSGRGGGRGHGRGRAGSGGSRGAYAERGSGRGRGAPRARGRGGFGGVQRKKGPERLLKLGEVTAWVLVEKKTVPVFAIKDSGPMSLTCLVESSVNREFAVGFRDDRPLASAGMDVPDLLCEVVVDGVVCSADRQIIRAWRNPKQFSKHEMASQRAYTWWGQRDSENTLRHFRFSSLALTADADDATVTTETALKALGTIQLRVYRGRVGDATDWREGDGATAVIGGASVWEESKKVQMGIAHQAGLGPARLHGHSARSTFEFDRAKWPDSAKKPWITFEWKYRDRTTLEIAGHIQPEESPADATLSPAPSASSSRSRSRDLASIKPKPNPLAARTPSPDVLYPRSPSSAPPDAPPEKIDTKGKGRARLEDDKKPLRRSTGKQPAPLGEMVLDSSSSPSPPPPSRLSRAQAKARLSPSASVDDADAEIARLRAEIAEYKRRELEQLQRERDEAKQRELEKLRRERDEAKRRVEGRAGNGRSAVKAGEPHAVAQVDSIANLEAEKAREAKEADEVASQLLPRPRPPLSQKRPSEGDARDAQVHRPVKRERREKDVEVLLLDDSD